MNMDRLLIGV